MRFKLVTGDISYLPLDHGVESNIKLEIIRRQKWPAKGFIILYNYVLSDHVTVHLLNTAPPSFCEVYSLSFVH